MFSSRKGVAGGDRRGTGTDAGLNVTVTILDMPGHTGKYHCDLLLQLNPLSMIARMHADPR